jgi:hypothetical protein
MSATKFHTHTELQEPLSSAHLVKKVSQHDYKKKFNGKEIYLHEVLCMNFASTRMQYNIFSGDIAGLGSQ